MRADRELVIRPANASEADDVRRCVHEAYDMYVERIGRAPAPMMQDYARLIADGVVHVATRDEVIDGVIVMWDDGDHVHVDNVATRPAVRGTGVGARLLDWAEARAAEQGVSELRLYTNSAMTENVDYYRRRGYVETHRATEAGYERVYFAKTIPS